MTPTAHFFLTWLAWWAAIGGPMCFGFGIGQFTAFDSNAKRRRRGMALFAASGALLSYAFAWAAYMAAAR